VAPGLYLHVPFCTHVCGYCDFNAHAGMSDLMPAYAEALRRDLDRVAAAGPGPVAPPHVEVAADWPAFGSIFVGGGTPTLLPAADLAAVLRHARDVLPFSDDVEVTTEANPESVTAEGLGRLVEAGLTRVSIGAQSSSARVLGFLDRRHNPESVPLAVAAARSAGVAVVNLDLIYGAPAETRADWETTLVDSIAVDPDHVSAYALTLEANTTYAARVRAGEQAAPDEDVAGERMAAAAARLGEAGFERYEISNWARPGARCRHNANYWAGGDYLGVGAGAHGHWNGRRWWALRPPRRWVDVVLAGGDPTSGQEVVDEAGRRAERLLLGLRRAEGVARADVEPVDDAQAAVLVRGGLLADDGRRLVLTAAGRPLANAVTLRLLPS
jgi:putative oxygen-independent coproporphyrinogen III oxidase